MINLLAAISKALGKVEHLKPQKVERASKHHGGKQRPRDFDTKRKTRRKIAKASRRINRRML